MPVIITNGFLGVSMTYKFKPFIKASPVVLCRNYHIYLDYLYGTSMRDCSLRYGVSLSTVKAVSVSLGCRFSGDVTKVSRAIQQHYNTYGLI